MVITSSSNEKIKYLIKLNQKKYRDKTFLVEGKHLVEESYKKGLIKQLILLETTTSNFDVETLYVTNQIMQKISNTINPPQMMAEVYKKDNIITGNKIIMLDDIADPGNLGTIIRSAVAFNFDTVILSKNTVDLYNPKTIRATEGMLFNINIVTSDLEDTILNLKKNGFKILGTKVTKGKDIKNYLKTDKIALIIGSEAKGMSKQLENLCDENIYIKMNEKCESLNAGVSASILMYELNQ